MGKTKGHSSWAEVAKAMDKAAAELALRRAEPPPTRPSRAAPPPTPAGDHLVRLRSRLAKQRERRAAAKLAGLAASSPALREE